MALTTDAIIDLVTTTQKELGKMKWTEIATDLTEHVAMSRMLRKERVGFDSGNVIQWNLQVDHNDEAENVGMYAVDNVDVPDTMINAEIPWRHTTTKYAFDRVEMKINRTPAKIVDLVKTRRAAAMIALAELMETNWFNAPASSSDTVAPFGIPYYIVSDTSGDNAATGVGGFTSDTPSGHTLIANVNPATYPRWGNWSHQYVNVTKNDLVRKMRRAFRKTAFKSPTQIPSYDRGGPRHELLMNIDTITEIEEVGEQQNENLGRDIASMDDRIVFRRAPITYVPTLDSDSTDPVYFIDWSVFYPVFLEGEYMLEEAPIRAPNQHKVFRVFIDTTWNIKCHNRRRLAVLLK